MMSANSSQCLSGKLAVPLSTSNICNAGFYCPNNTAQHPPVYCPPTTECLITRLQFNENTCAQPQGVYEPIACEPGYYCPAGGKEQIICPKGNYCPRGSIEPIKCKTLSKCNQGSEYELPFLGFLVCGILDLSLMFLFVFFHIKRRRGLAKRREEKESLGWNMEMRSEDQDNSDTGDWLELLFSLDSNNVGMELKFENISLRKPKTRDFILSGVTGKAHSKSLTGIMGQSGSGKTTLTNILVGKVRADSGSLMLNKVPRDLAKGYHFPALIGFVPQDDIVHPHLTVFENILHSARIRLGGKLNDQAIQERVNLVIDGLGLTKVKSSVVGSPQKPIISGGERKRVSIGLELVAAPQVLILDEPTSGLDAQAALSIMALLKRFSREGLTVICVVHQPRVEIFEALDSLLVLEQGQCIYSGKAMDAKQYFEDQGFRFNPTLNPADLIIDIASGKFEAGRSKLEEWKHPGSPNETMAPSSSGESDREYTDLSFRNIEADYNKRFAPWYRQVWLCILRDLLQQTRQLAVFVVEITGAALTGTLIGLVAHEFHGQVFQGIYLSPFSTLSSAVNYGTVTEIGVLTCLAISFSAAYPSVATFAEEELVFKRESHSGHSESAYFIGKAISVLPRLFLAALHFTTVYLVLATPFASFNMLLTLNFLYFYCIYGLGSVAIAISNRANSPLVCLLMAIVIAVLGGSQPRLATVKTWHLEWLWDMSPGLWFTEAVVNEHVKRLEYLYDMKVAGFQTGYTFGRTGFDSGILLLIGSLCRGIGCLMMVFRARTGW